MNEKTKNLLMREAYMGAVALGIFIVVFVLCSVLPGVKEIVQKTLLKNADLKKVVSLCIKIVKEISPF